MGWRELDHKAAAMLSLNLSRRLKAVMDGWVMASAVDKFWKRGRVYRALQGWAGLTSEKLFQRARLARYRQEAALRCLTQSYVAWQRYTKVC